jgi:hypothetical protein
LTTPELRRAVLAPSALARNLRPAAVTTLELRRPVLRRAVLAPSALARILTAALCSVLRRRRPPIEALCVPLGAAHRCGKHRNGAA